MVYSEHLVQYRDCGGIKTLLGNPPTVGSSGANGTLATSRAWRSTLKRQTYRQQVTGTGPFHMMAYLGARPQRDPSGFMPLMPPTDMIYRIREGLAAEYVSGTGVSIAAWGLFKSWGAALKGAPSAAFEPGFIGFIWYQVGAVRVNWRAVAANHAGDNLFDTDTGLTAPDVPYNFRIDINGRIGQRKIVYYIDEVEVAAFTPADDVLGGTNASPMVLGAVVNAQNGNVCALHSEMLGANSWEFLVQEGA